MQAMIFAAGLGTRLKPLTDTMPKAMVSVGGEPLLKRVIMRLRDAGFNHLVVNVHHFAQQIIDYLADNDNFGLNIHISDETEQLLDTGGGIKKAKHLFIPDSPILIHNVDILSNVDLQKFYDAAKEGDATLLVSNRKTKRYLLFNDEMRLVGWTNMETGEVRSPYPNLDVKSCRMYAFAGIHVLSPRMIAMTENFPDKFGIIDFYLQSCDKVCIKGYLKEDLRLMDVGKLDTLKDAEEFIKSCL